MEFTQRDERLIRRLHQPAHRFPFHLSASIVLLIAGISNVIKGVRLNEASEIWLGCLIGVMAIVWIERLHHDRSYRRLLSKLSDRPDDMMK